MCANGGNTDTTAAPEHPGEPDDGTRLVEVVRRAKNGEASPHDVFETFLQARVYCERPDNPGFLTVTASEVPGEDDHAPRGSRILDLAVVSDTTAPTQQPARLVPVFTSLEQFALFTGGGAWFSTTGADVLDLLPPGLDVWLDPAAEHAVRLASAATKIEPVLHISYRGSRGAA
ncbi:SseB family protein [Streptomyces sp. Vc74B-19]|uniref:SseB family protein n=1 Tax=unclassified Streptomyces TaxID=2593676 RepID=UPI001BFCA659|nr:MULTISPECIES: SseB family protein [unclassified Streptomyces]MBT3166166.1 SseB family protein [Streptomyces sp. Vc74B-19]MCO4699879.1 SseB family protein [Streptomyces sp. RO-S4]